MPMALFDPVRPRFSEIRPIGLKLTKMVAASVHFVHLSRFPKPAQSPGVACFNIVGLSFPLGRVAFRNGNEARQ